MNLECGVGLIPPVGPGFSLYGTWGLDSACGAWKVGANLVQSEFKVVSNGFKVDSNGALAGYAK